MSGTSQSGDLTESPSLSPELAKSSLPVMLQSHLSPQYLSFHYERQPRMPTAEENLEETEKRKMGEEQWRGGRRGSVREQEAESRGQERCWREAGGGPCQVMELEGEVDCEEKTLELRRKEQRSPGTPPPEQEEAQEEQGRRA